MDELAWGSFFALAWWFLPLSLYFIIWPLCNGMIVEVS
jgi:hypothetical protein